MNKSLLIFVLILGACCRLCFSQTAGATGQWEIFPFFSPHLDKIVDTPSDKVYYLTCGSLYSYDRSTDEHYSYTKQNKLSSSGISDIKYNPFKGYLLVIYEDANMDLLYDSGKVVNIPDINVASIPYTKKINDIWLDDTGIYCATSFGIVVIDDERHLVRESGIYGRNIEYIGVMGNKLIIIYDYQIRTAPLAALHNSLDKFSESAGVHTSGIYPLSDKVLLTKVVDKNGDYLHKITFNEDMSRWSREKIVDKVDSDIIGCSEGVYVIENDRIRIISPDGDVMSTVNLPESFVGIPISWYTNPERIYTGERGLALYDITSNPPTVLMDGIIPENNLTCKKIAFMQPSVDGNRIYLSNLGTSGYNAAALGDGYETPVQRVNVIEDGRVSDITIEKASADNPYVVKAMENYPDGAWLGSPGMAVEDSDFPQRYYCANGMEGVYVIENGEEIGKFNSLNSKMDTPWGNPGGRTMGIAIDPGGNLWVGSVVAGDKKPHNYGSVIVLPAAKRRGNPADVTIDDWVEIPVDVFDGKSKDIRIFPCRKSGMVFIVRDGSGIICYDTAGTYDNFADDRYTVHEYFTDRDGAEFTPFVNICFAEDANGRVWMGTSQGIVEITNPTATLSPDFRVNRIKVPRNDGTNLADYLLSSESVYAISPDHAGRKWIATEKSGAYLVSANGDEIIAHLTSANSHLPSDEVYSLAVDANSNKVYFATSAGLAAYSSTASPAASDFSDIIVYPNPVRPDYEGPVTIKGLMDGSLVKIADSQGNVVYNTRAEGGMASWDCCNVSGQSVRSGVYYVIASHSDSTGGNTSGASAKFLIIR